MRDALPSYRHGVPPLNRSMNSVTWLTVIQLDCSRRIEGDRLINNFTDIFSYLITQLSNMITYHVRS